MARKKYYQSKKDRKNESRGMKRRLGDERKANDPRRRMEWEDSMMIREDHSAMANLPQNPMLKYYPRFEYGLDSRLDDTVGGIDRQMYDDMDGMKRHLKPEKY